MEYNWKSIKLSEIGKIITGKTPSTKEKENFGGKIPFLTPSDDMDSRYVLKTIRYLTDVGANKLSNKIVPKNSICTSCIGSQLGKVTITTEDTVSNQQINTIIPNKNYNYLFVYYLMLLVGKRLNYISKTSTAVPIINKNDFSEMVVEVPNKDIQNRISVILDRIDSKIEVNNKVIANLEEQAHAIFKSWFVDFEPFQDGNFVESELGMIPEGWEVSITGEEFNIEYGKNLPTKNLLEKGYPVYGGNGQIGFYNKYLYSKPRLLVSCRGAASGKVGLSKAHSFVTNNSLVFNEKTDEYFYYYKYLFNNSVFENYVTGSAQPQLTIKNSTNIKILVPNKNVICNFNKIIGDNFKKQNVLDNENKKLVEIRDALLPKLMSGEIDVSNIKIKGEEVKNEWNLFRRWFWKNLYKIYWGLRLPLPPSSRNCKR